MNWSLDTITPMMNYENLKLPVQNPDLLNFIFLFTIVGLILLTVGYRTRSADEVLTATKFCCPNNSYSKAN
jgi:hypothetical protein